MKTALKYCGITNLCLAICLTWALIRLRVSTLPTDAALGFAENKQKSKTACALEPTPAKSIPFRWSQLESSDYRIYIGNLRRVECPERTVRDIIEADVASLYTARRRELHLAENDGGPWSRFEAMQLVDLLLGAGTAVPSVERPANSKAVARLRLPLVLQTVDAMSLELEPGQREAIEQLREEFVARVGGTEHDPTDPAFRQLWQQAQPEIDEKLAGTIGGKAYLELESAAGTADELVE